MFGVNTDPKYRKHGYAAKIMEQVIADAKKQGRKGCILTCKEELIHYYEKFGYKNEGISQSALGDAVWYDMRLEF
ncbi:GNAT family N-acetyltransferase [Peribacillus loiseleuriae]|uniref:GNAT family N-acetyltransferase n=1 Tax=Peribacillus loiseleuriae TaxID=1679170 RepID=UPI00381C6EFA